MRFRSYDSLKVFDAVARCESITGAARELNLSKGAVSYQIGKLEADLGFRLFNRNHPRISLTRKGERLWHASQVALGQLDREIADLREESRSSVTIGLLTYFGSRWLSPRLMGFVEENPGIGLRIEPLSGEAGLSGTNLDFAILWGTGEWTELEADLLFPCPAVPTASPTLAAEARALGMSRAFATLPLLADSSGEQGWRDWHRAAGLPYKPRTSGLVYTDSNSRVQAVIDGLGIALWDSLVEPEMRSGKLEPVFDVWLDTCGYYLIYPNGRPEADALRRFQIWIVQEAAKDLSEPTTPTR